MQNAVGIFTNIGRLSMAAKHLKDIAEIYEKEDNAEDALTFYQQAADLYAGEEVNRYALYAGLLLSGTLFPCMVVLSLASPVLKILRLVNETVTVVPLDSQSTFYVLHRLALAFVLCGAIVHLRPRSCRSGGES